MNAANRHRNTVSMEIRVRGRVQGVGFRPMVWRLAAEIGLTGTVCNDAQGVLIHASAPRTVLSEFLVRLQKNTPPLAIIEDIDSFVVQADEIWPDFRIVDSFGGESLTEVTPDAATCDACRAEILNPAERRHRYPFTNCTHCGPRFSIVNTVPYDRANTTMASFQICPSCQSEYENPNDRRYHAQPIACPDCGPKIWLKSFPNTKKPFTNNALQDDIEKTADLLRRGNIIAIRGLGGFHLACDATNHRAVERLRTRKRRYGKPFALMARDIGVIRRYCRVNHGELTALQSAAAPIVVLEVIGENRLPDSIAPDLGSLGFMLPYTPLHHLLMQHIDEPLVMTSGNTSNEPQVTNNDVALKKLSSIADHILMHDRDIANRIDDSVMRYMAGKPSVLRRARGYAPGAIALPRGFEDAPDIMAFGSELKSTFCLLKNGSAVLSPHQGDLEDPATLDDFEKNMALYRSLFDHEATLLACDLHPEYLSSKLATETGENTGLAIAKIQHHHAHIASCMAENGVALNDGPVLGIALDGLGMGDDATLWGGEFLLADYVGYKRLATFKPVAMPGGAQAVYEPWRNTYAHLQSAIGWTNLLASDHDLSLIRYLSDKPLAILDNMQARGVNSPLASSCGRLFDAVAAAVGICRDQAFYEAQGAIEIEAAATSEQNETGEYPFSLGDFDLDKPALVDSSPLWRPLLDDLRHKTPVSVIAARFHNGLASAIARMATTLIDKQKEICNEINVIALTGGCFQNKLLLETVIARLATERLKILTHNRVPANDGGVSLGQVAIAAARHLNDTGSQGRI